MKTGITNATLNSILEYVWTGVKYVAVGLGMVFIGVHLNFFTFSSGVPTFINISTQTWNTVVGVVLGFVASLGVQSIIRRRQESRTTRNLRRALIAELTSMDNFYKIFQKNINFNHSMARHVAENVSTNVYENNIQQLGKLSSIETQSIVLYYSSLSNVRSIIRASAESDPDEGTTLQLSEDILIRLNAVWRLLLNLIKSKIDTERRPPEREMVNIGREEEFEEGSIYNEIQEELEGEDISKESAERLIEKALSQGELLSETHSDVKDALEEKDGSIQHNVHSEEGSRQVNIDPNQ